ncbi:hypothetical protein FQA39_LY07677 [Lamprigera yunnana]|nr:hypothetical protein FQA39_LY07677 [Lamprigera yunnana]
MFKLFMMLVLFNVVKGSLIAPQERGSNLKNCVKNVIENLFNDKKTVLFVYKGDDCDFFPNTIQSPFMSINNKINSLKSYKIDDEVIVIDLRMMKLNTLGKYKVWSWGDVRRRKFIIIDKLARYTLKYALPSAWYYEITDPIFLLEDTKNNSVKVFTSHPHHPLNKCGQSGEFVQEHDCNNLETIKKRIYSWGLHDCNVSYLHDMDTPLDKFYSEDYMVMNLVLETIRNDLNATVTVEDEDKSASNRLFVRLSKVNSCHSSRCNSLFLRKKFVWTVPPPRNATSKMTLKKIIWIISILSVLLIEISWWVLSKYVKRTNLSSLFAKEFSVTMLGSVYRIPKRFVLRFGFLVCTIYFLYFQTAFNSDLLQKMALSQFQPKIKTVEQLADSKIPIIIPSNMKYLFKHKEANKTIYSKIQRKLLMYLEKHYLKAVSNIKTFERYSVLASMDDVVTMTKIFKAKVPIIVDSTITGVKAHSINVRTSSRILPSLNKVVIFGFNPLLLPEEENKAIQDCVSNFVLREFTENRPIYHVHDGSEPVIMPYVGNNPYVIIDVNKPIKEAEHYVSYYIFQTANRSSFKDMYNKMGNYSIWKHFDLREKKCLIIASNSEEIVHELDTSATYIAVYNYTNEIYTCDRYHVGNRCGAKCNILTKHQCNTNKNYFKTSGRFHNCSVVLGILGEYTNLTIHEVVKFIVAEFTNYLGFSLNITLMTSANPNPTEDFIVLPWSTIGNRFANNPIYTFEYGWVTFVDKIPPTKILQYTLEETVWILIGVTLLLTLLIWCLITKLTGNGWNVGTSSTNILALTLVGCLSNLPQPRSLKCLILFYLMFVVIIQTAFKTNLAQLLTVDRYDKSFDNVKDLADSDVPVCIVEESRQLFERITKEDSVHIKIKKRLISIKSNTDALKYRNCTYLMYLDHIFFFMKNYNFNYFIDNDLSKHKVSLYLWHGRHLTETVNSFVQRFKDNGIIEHTISKAHKKRDYDFKRIQEDSETKVLTMKHVCGIFVIWAVGVALSVIVFLVEILSQKFATK